MSKHPKRAKQVTPKYGIGSISDMFKRQSQAKANKHIRKDIDVTKECNKTSVKNWDIHNKTKTSVILIESSADSSDSESSFDSDEHLAAGVGGRAQCQITRFSHGSNVRHTLKRKIDSEGVGESERYDDDFSTPLINPGNSNSMSTVSAEISLDNKGKGANTNLKNCRMSKEDHVIDAACEGATPPREREGEDGSEVGERNVYREPYYKKNFETILNTITEDTYVSTLFSDADNTAVNSYLSVSEQAKQLYVRILGRKFKWIPSGKIKYPEIGENLSPYLKELTDSQLIHDENSLTDLSDVLETLSAGDVKAIAKMYHIASPITQKKQIIEELLKLCRKNTVSSMFGSKGGVAAAMLKKSKAMVHGAYKLQQEPRSVFIRVMMLFSLVNTTGDEDSGNGGQGQLFQMLMVNMGKVVYPSYEITKKHKVFKTRDDVVRFEHALQLESDLLHAIEKGMWSAAYDVFCVVSKQLDGMQQDKDIAVWNESLPDFLRSFTAMSVLYRLMSQGIDILQRRKEYDNAVTSIKRLLNQEFYCCNHRGYWWERLALNLDVHLKKPSQALEAIASGLEDQHVIGGHRLALFQRAESICDKPKLKLKHRISEFHHDPVKELPKVYIEGRILHQGVTSAGPRFLTEGSYTNGNAQEMTVCGVEEFVMGHYRSNGYPSGLHAEGSIVTSLFGLFFWDILFLAIPDAFHSLYQAQPLDLYSTSSFYSARKDAIDDRLAQLETSSFDSLSEMMEETWNKEHGKLCVGMSWERLNSIEDVKGLVQCIGGKALSGILRRYARCPRHTRSGFPDLTLWNVNTGAWKICEVKGPGDKLSHKQILWLDYLLGLGVDAEVCHVKAVAAKKLRPSS